ncbi:MAG: hypothetical protein GY827_09820 [Cytophagales bacterium]|nr:hypothetical protein [Cytophagales bacterium]
MTTTEKIEKYLLGELSETETQAFEQQVNQDNALKEEVELQKALTQRVQRMAFLSAIQSVQGEFSTDGQNPETPDNTPNQPNTSPTTGTGSSSLLKTIGGSVIVGMIATASYFWLNQPEKQKIVPPTSPVETVDTNQIITQPIQETPQKKKIETEKAKEEGKTNVHQIKIRKQKSEVNRDSVWVSEEVVEVSNTWNPFSTIQVPTERFKIQPSKEEYSVIASRDKIQVQFPPNAFDCDGKVQIELRTYVDLVSIVKAKISTQYKKNTFSTDGIIWIKATEVSTGKVLSLKKDAVVLFPRKTFKNTQLSSLVSANDNYKWKKYISEEEKIDLDSREPTSVEEALLAMKGEETLNKWKKEKKDYHICYFDDFGWIMTGQLINSQATVEVEIEKQGDSNLDYFIISKGTNGLSIIHNTNGKFDNVPKNKKLTLIGIGEDGNEYFVGKSDFTSSQDVSLSLSHQIIDKKELNAFLQKIMK